jgi:hypothetical protein
MSEQAAVLGELVGKFSLPRAGALALPG